MTKDTTPPHTGQLRSYGRTQGRALSERRQELFDALLPTITVPDSAQGELDPESLFAQKLQNIWLEIGFGGAEHLCQQAKRSPDVGIIGVEPFKDGVAKALSFIDDMKLENVCLHHGDARDIVERLTANSLDRVFILFPDPWPKKRHWKRRIVQSAFINDLVRVVKPGGQIRFATDVASYADWALELFLKNDQLIWLAKNADDWRTPPEDHITTRYQEKKLGDCAPVWFDFERR